MKKVKLEVLPKSDNPLYLERELGVTHTPFKLELSLFNAIKDGDEEALKKAIQDYLDYGVIIGNMTGIQGANVYYWGIATISTATHYAILGGLDETDAYNMSDKYLQELSTIRSFEECLSFLESKGIELVRAVKRVKERNPYSHHVSKALHYIHIHLHEKITIDDIASHLGISRDYLSILFKNEVGVSLHRFINSEKVKASLPLLEKNKPINEIAYILGFCSETHFITVFKKELGMTPKRFKTNQK